jgi:hypothetical protein
MPQFVQSLHFDLTDTLPGHIEAAAINLTPVIASAAIMSGTMFYPIPRAEEPRRLSCGDWAFIIFTPPCLPAFPLLQKKRQRSHCLTNKKQPWIY